MILCVVGDLFILPNNPIIVSFYSLYSCQFMEFQCMRGAVYYLFS